MIERTNKALAEMARQFGGGYCSMQIDIDMDGDGVQKQPTFKAYHTTIGWGEEKPNPEEAAQDCIRIFIESVAEKIAKVESNAREEVDRLRELQRKLCSSQFKDYCSVVPPVKRKLASEERMQLEARPKTT